MPKKKVKKHKLKIRKTSKLKSLNISVRSKKKSFKKKSVTLVAPIKEKVEDHPLPKWGKRYIEGFKRYGTKKHAAEYAGIVRITADRWIAKCSELKKAIVAAEEDLTDELEQSALNRATHGTHDLVLYEGQIVYYTNEKNKYIRDEEGNRIPVYKKKLETALTIFMLKARRRDRYLIDNLGQGGSADEKAEAIRNALMAIANSIPISA